MPDFADSYDSLSKSTVLRHSGVRREFFDPTNQLHLDSLAHFIRTGNWGQVQFFCEYPFSDVPMTVLMKFAGNSLDAHRETAEDRIKRTLKAA